MSKPITLEEYVVQCKMPYDGGEERELYVGQDVYYTPYLTDAKFFSSVKNAKLSISYHSRNNKSAHDYVIFKVRRTFEIIGIFQGETNAD